MANEENAARSLPQMFREAWMHHDGHQLAQIMADDVDFVTLAALWLHGRADFEKYHTRLLAGHFKKRYSSLRSVGAPVLRTANLRSGASCQKGGRSAREIAVRGNHRATGILPAGSFAVGVVARRA
jgi:uncharacterized protein (TIGR02246 family)